MNEITTIGLDCAKSVFQVHGLDAEGNCCLARRLKRGEVVKVFAKLPACRVVLEAGGSAHYWGRALMALGHEVKLAPASFVKRFLASRRRKNDARDAQALALAGRSGELRAVPVKSEVRQAELLIVKSRGLLIRQRTQLGNALRGHLGEFGLIARSGEKGLEALLDEVESGRAELPQAALPALAALIGQWRSLAHEIAKLDARLIQAAKGNETVKRLMSVPGVGPVIATVFALKVDDPARFACGRNCAAWLGLTPGEHSSGKRRRRQGITKAGDEDLRSLLVLGARSLLNRAKRYPAAADPWTRDILKRRPYKVASVALAGRLARRLWALLKHGGVYRPQRPLAA